MISVTYSQIVRKKKCVFMYKCIYIYIYIYNYVCYILYTHTER